jgi:DNA methylase
MDFFLPFSFKIMIAERSPSEDKAKGLLDRSLPIKTYKGLPDYDIKEVRKPEGDTERQQLLDQIMDLRKVLLAYKLVHFKDPLPQVDVGLDGRDKELCKPLLQLFYGLGASKETLNEIENALKHEKNTHPMEQSTVEAKHFMEALTVEGYTVLDPFCGSGTTGQAALELDRKFIGLDKDQFHYSTALRDCQL